jgi:hypothetical protein
VVPAENGFDRREDMGIADAIAAILEAMSLAGGRAGVALQRVLDILNGLGG